MSADEIARVLNINYKTVYRFLLTLEDVGAVKRGANTRFFLGVKLADLGQQVAIHRLLYAASMPELHRLVEVFGESAQVAVRANDEITAIAYVAGTVGIPAGIPVGRTFPLHCTAVGKVLLAGMDDAKLRSLCRVLGLETPTSNMPGGGQAFVKHIAKVRKDGYAINDRESDYTVRAAAVPIRNSSGRVIAAISLSGHCDRISHAGLSRFVSGLTQSAARISDAIYQKSTGSAEGHGGGNIAPGLGS